MYFVKNPGDTWRIVIPTSLSNPIIYWYHQILAHVGMTRWNATVSTHFYYPPLKARVEHIASIYETCQNVQNYLVLGFGELPPRNALLLQCSEVTMDFIGPWKITLTAQAIEFHAPTWVNTVTNLPEISHINNKTSEYIAMKFKNDWLDGYLRPEGCIHDNGGQLTGIPFIHIKSLCTSHVKGSSSNQGISSSEYCGYQFAASYAARATIYSTLCIFTRNMGFPTWFDYRYVIDIGISMSISDNWQMTTSWYFPSSFLRLQGCWWGFNPIG